jgi:hypothetical protein
VTNGSFDATSPSTKINFQNNVPGWTGGARLTFLAPPGTADNISQYLAVYGPFPATSPDGGNFILADGDPPYADPFEQTITGLTVGQSYTLRFWQAAGQQAGFQGATTERWRVTFGSDVRLSDQFNLPEGGVGPWERQTMTFVATATSQLLEFLAVGTPGGGPPISFLDGVSLEATTVPAPASLGLLGMGLLGLLAARRRKRQG